MSRGREEEMERAFSSAATADEERDMAGVLGGGKAAVGGLGAEEKMAARTTARRERKRARRAGKVYASDERRATARKTDSTVAALGRGDGGVSLVRAKWGRVCSRRQSAGQRTVLRGGVRTAELPLQSCSSRRTVRCHLAVRLETSSPLALQRCRRVTRGR